METPYKQYAQKSYNIWIELIYTKWSSKSRTEVVEKELTRPTQWT